MTIDDDLQQIAVFRELDPRVCVPSDPECTLPIERRRSGGALTGGSGKGCMSEVGTLTSPASTGTQSYTHSLGVAPKLIIMSTTGQTADGITTDALFSIGAAVSSSVRTGIAVNREHGAANFDTSRWHDNTVVIVTLTKAGVILEQADLVSFSATQFTLDWEATDGAAIKYHYALLGGGNFEANVVQHIAPTSPDSSLKVAHGLSGGAPTGAFAFAANNFAAPPSNDGLGGEATVSLGASDMTDDRFGGIDIFETGPNTRSQSSKFLSHTQTTITEEAVILSADATDVTLDWEIANSAEYYYIVFLRGCSVKVGSYTSPASAPNTTSISTGLPSPMLFMNWGFMNIASSAVEDDARLIFGLSDGTNNVCTGLLNNTADTDADRFNSAAKCLQVYNHTPTLLEEATAAFSGSMVDVAFTTAESALNEFQYLAIG